MRCVLDTNVIVSAMVSRTGTPGVSLASAYDTSEILVSVPLMRELHDIVLQRRVEPSGARPYAARSVTLVDGSARREMIL